MAMNATVGRVCKRAGVFSTRSLTLHSRRSVSVRIAPFRLVASPLHYARPSIGMAVSTDDADVRLSPIIAPREIEARHRELLFVVLNRFYRLPISRLSTEASPAPSVPCNSKTHLL
jgi:hypothetical protein